MSKKWIVPLVFALIAVRSTLGQDMASPILTRVSGSSPLDPPLLKDPPQVTPPTILKAPSEAPVPPVAKPPQAPPPALTCQPDLKPILNPVDSTYGVLTADADYMLWFVKRNLGTVPTSIYPTAGNEQDLSLQSSSLVSGGRVGFGYWMNEENPWVPAGVPSWGVDARFLFVGSSSANTTIENSPLYRPFFNLNSNSVSGFLVAEPGTASGILTAHASSNLWGADTNFWKNIFYDSPGTAFIVNVGAGFRYMNANTSVGVSSNTVFAQAPTDPTYASLAGNQLQVVDSFGTHNNFYGGQLGISLNYWVAPCFNFDLSFKLALGATVEDLNISGSQSRTLPNGTTTTSAGGLLALPSNIGSFQISKFSQIPEINFKLNFPVCSYLTLSTGFSGFYWNRVLLASQQIDRNIDVSQLSNYPPGAGSTSSFGHPAVSFTQSSLTVLGISLGAEFRW